MVLPALSLWSGLAREWALTLTDLGPVRFRESQELVSGRSMVVVMVHAPGVARKACQDRHRPGICGSGEGGGMPSRLVPARTRRLADFVLYTQDDLHGGSSSCIKTRVSDILSVGAVRRLRKSFVWIVIEARVTTIPAGTRNSPDCRPVPARDTSWKRNEGAPHPDQAPPDDRACSRLPPLPGPRSLAVHRPSVNRSIPDDR